MRTIRLNSRGGPLLESARDHVGKMWWPYCNMSPPVMIVDPHAAVRFKAVPSRVMKLRPTDARHGLHGVVRVEIIFALYFLLCGCRPRPTTNEPSIQFSKVPPAAQGGREKVDTISGSFASGAHIEKDSGCCRVSVDYLRRKR